MSPLKLDAGGIFGGMFSGRKKAGPKRIEPQVEGDGFVIVNTAVDGLREVDTSIPPEVDESIPKIQNKYASWAMNVVFGGAALFTAYAWWVLHSQKDSDSSVNRIATMVMNMVGEKSALDETLALRSDNATYKKQLDAVPLMAKEMVGKEEALKQREAELKNRDTIINMQEITIENLQAVASGLDSKLKIQRRVNEQQHEIIVADTAKIGQLETANKNLAELNQNLTTQLAASRPAGETDQVATNPVASEVSVNPESSETAPAAPAVQREAAPENTSAPVQLVPQSPAVQPSVKTEDQEKQVVLSLFERDSIRPEAPVATPKAEDAKIGNEAVSPEALKKTAATGMVPGGVTKIDLSMAGGVPSVAIHTEASNTARSSSAESPVVAVPGEQLALLEQSASDSVINKGPEKPLVRNEAIEPTTGVRAVATYTVAPQKSVVLKPNMNPAISYKELQSLIKGAESALAPGAELHTSQVSKGRFKVWMTYNGTKSLSFFTDTPKHQNRLTRAGMKQWAAETMNYFEQLPLIKEIAGENQMSLRREDAQMDGVLFLSVGQSSLRNKIRFVLVNPRGKDVDFTMPIKDIKKESLGPVLKSVREKSEKKSLA